jgi:acyl-CoA reductase-like NAD-dependent aldehyde dehydrogenase
MSDTQTWQKRALDLKPQSQIFIDGKFVDAASGKTFENLSYSDGHLFCFVASGETEVLNRAVASAK